VNEVRLGRVEDIPDGGSAGYDVETDHGRRFYLAVRRGDRVFVYINACPHTGAPLDFEPGRFLDLERTRILCANHGALFRIEDGYCLSGPCAGKHLEPAPAVIRSGFLVLCG
jgi:nitrite reductase/ring-hydroxylating ferredoxin subunit